MNIDKKPILVTGSHRSGTTWVGKIISEAHEIVYIHEPLNIDYSLARYGRRLDRWFTYICEENENDYISYYQDLFKLKVNLKETISASKSKSDILKSIKYYLYFSKASYLQKRPLLKDPISFFSAEWLASRSFCDVLVLIRHPAAFVSSIKLKNWNFPFSHFLEQKLLMRDYLNPFRAQIYEYSKQKRNVIDQSILLWNIFHHVILIYKEKHDDWLFYRHEDISIDPEFIFKEIFEFLDLEFSEAVESAIMRSSDSSNSCETTENIHLTKRNSKMNIFSWKNRLTQEEIEKVKRETSSYWKNFYSEEEW